MIASESCCSDVWFVTGEELHIVALLNLRLSVLPLAYSSPPDTVLLLRGLTQLPQTTGQQSHASLPTAVVTAGDRPDPALKPLQPANYCCSD